MQLESTVLGLDTLQLLLVTTAGLLAMFFSIEDTEIPSTRTALSMCC